MADADQVQILTLTKNGIDEILSSVHEGQRRQILVDGKGVFSSRAALDTLEHADELLAGDEMPSGLRWVVHLLIYRFQLQSDSGSRESFIFSLLSNLCSSGKSGLITIDVHHS